MIALRAPAGRARSDIGQRGPSGAGTEPAAPRPGAAATISLFIGTRAAWTDALTLSPTVMAVISVGYLAILGLAALSLVVRTQRALVVVDVLILVTAAVQVVGALILQHKPTDEGTLIAQAARSLLGGGEIYGVAWPQLFAQQHLPVTWMMGGGADYTLGYPPLAVLLTAAGAPRLQLPGRGLDRHDTDAAHRGVRPVAAPAARLASGRDHRDAGLPVHAPLRAARDSRRSSPWSG